MTVQPGQTLNLTLVINIPGSASTTTSSGQELGWIDGTVTIAGTTTPVAGVTVTLAGTPLSTTSSTGTYQFAALSTTAGASGGPTYTVQVTPPTGYRLAGSGSQQVTVKAGQGVEADFTLLLPCQFVLGFQTLHALLPTTIGSCLDDESHSPTTGDALQHTTGGLLVWRKADNFTAFTDGYHTWLNGPYGVQERLNTQRFPWESNPDHLPLAS